MSTFVFSDTHFGKRFDEHRFQKLKSLIEKSETVIINGDLWEGLAITFDDFLNSQWNKLFPYLKERNTIYVYGNHDDKNLSDERVSLFSNLATDSYLLETNKQKYYFIHGHEFLFPHVPIELEAWKSARSLVRKIETHTSELIQYSIFNILGPKAFPKRFNNIDDELREKIIPRDHLLVCGHTHAPQYRNDNNFINIGFFNYGWGNYVLIDKKGDFELRNERYW